MMNSPEPKRTLTEKMQLDTDTTNASRTDGVEDDLFARLRGVGSRVRSSVNSGYLNNYAPPVHPDSLAPTRTFFRSHSETLRDVYASQPSNSTSSTTMAPPKRFRARSIGEQDQPESADVQQSSSATPTAHDAEGLKEDATLFARPIKPLRQRRPLGKSTSMPAASLSLAPTPFPATSAFTPSTITEATSEDDWSESFGSKDDAGAFRPTYL